MLEQFLYLTTQGRITGNPHEIEIWFVEQTGYYYLVSGNDERADWVRNIAANPAVRFRVGDQTFIGKARAINASQEPELAAAVRAEMEAKYQWNDGLVIQLIPDPIKS